jgi:2-polyprenyl-3-methyl-5-hydroxy-6-metoxy-1,4-benzoquinol methylase
VHNLAVLPLPFPSERFDRIVCLDALEHIDVAATPREVNRLLVPGGFVDIRVPLRMFRSTNIKVRLI